MNPVALMPMRHAFFFSAMTATRSTQELRAIVRELESKDDYACYLVLRDCAMSELFAMHGMASRRLADLITLETRNTES